MEPEHRKKIMPADYRQNRLYVEAVEIPGRAAHLEHEMQRIRQQEKDLKAKGIDPRAINAGEVDEMKEV